MKFSPSASIHTFLLKQCLFSNLKKCNTFIEQQIWFKPVKYKNKNLNFLNDLSEPTLGDLLAHYQKLENATDDPIAELEEFLDQNNTSQSVIQLLNTLKQQRSKGDSFEAGYTLKALKKITVFRKNQEAQKLFQKIGNKLETDNHNSAHQKAMFTLCEMVDKELSFASPLTDINNHFSQAVFWLYTGFQTIGCVSSDGWQIGIFGNEPALVPYVSNVMNRIGFEHIARAFDEVVDVFPKGTNFSASDPCYHDVINYLENPRFKLSNIEECIPDGLNREKLHKQYIAALQNLEDIEEASWNDELEWRNLYDFYDTQLDSKIWK